MIDGYQDANFCLLLLFYFTISAKWLDTDMLTYTFQYISFHKHTMNLCALTCNTIIAFYPFTRHQVAKILGLLENWAAVDFTIVIKKYMHTTPYPHTHTPPVHRAYTHSLTHIHKLMHSTITHTYTHMHTALFYFVFH